MLCSELIPRPAAGRGIRKAEDCITITATPSEEAAASPSPTPWTLAFTPPTLVLPDPRGLAEAPDGLDTKSGLNLKFLPGLGCPRA